jgi:peptide-methionine (R)-S-oxide reductase
MASQSKASISSESCSPTEPSSCGATHWREKSEAEWRKTLSPEQFEIARNAGTERAFTGKYWNTKTPGTYQCACCGNELFRSETKFDSGSGWPSFYQPVKADAVITHADPSIPGRPRIEVRCTQCDAHLGHVFDDGPRPTGQRYCMNSAVLNLVPNEEATAKK